jgi:predicted N-formylglutamate amidohydrolase
MNVMLEIRSDLVETAQQQQTMAVWLCEQLEQGLSNAAKS